MSESYLGCNACQCYQIRATVGAVVVDRDDVLSYVRAEAEERILIIGTGYVLC